MIRRQFAPDCMATDFIKAGICGTPVRTRMGNALFGNHIAILANCAFPRVQLVAFRQEVILIKGSFEPPYPLMT